MEVARIPLQAVGPFAIATVAVLLAFYQGRIYQRNTTFTWNLWGALLSLCTAAYAAAGFTEYIVTSFAAVRNLDRVMYTALTFALHCLLGYTVAYLKLRPLRFHLLAGIIDVLLVCVIWASDLIVSTRPMVIDFIFLRGAYVKAALNPLGYVYYSIVAASSLFLLCLLIPRRKQNAVPTSQIAALGAWMVLGSLDGLVMVFHIPARPLMPLLEFGFLGFCLSVLSVAIRDYIALLDLAESRQRSLEQARNEADAANKAKSAFLAKMSHELRTPLNHVIGFTELVASGSSGALNDEQAEYLKDALRSSRHLLSLLNDILDVAKVEAGKMQLELSPVEIPPLLNECLTVISDRAADRTISLGCRFDALPPTITADGRKLRQVLLNLLSNAVKFTPSGGHVTLSARQVTLARGRPGVQFSVADTGVGLRPEDIERIFRPFEQVEDSSSRKYDGTGLGLSLSRELVNLHGGRIWGESAGPGEGSTFRFEIPAR